MLDLHAVTVVGRYTLLEEFASGGMASVHLGTMSGAAGFNRVVAIKRLHRQYAADPRFVAMLVEEVRVGQRVRHPNVAQLIDVVDEAKELWLVMEYIHGDSFARLARSGMPPSPNVTSAVVLHMLAGLGAAHEATTAEGAALNVVHRDVSPQNVIVGLDGHARVLDFGIAHAQGRLQTTQDGHLKGKIPYMAPEQIRGGAATPRFDIYAAGVVLWEALVGRRLYTNPSEAGLILEIVSTVAPLPRSLRPELPPAVDEVLARALAHDLALRYPSADAFAVALRHALPPASIKEVQEWVRSAGGEALQKRSDRIRDIEMGVPASAVTSGRDAQAVAELGSAPMIVASSVSTPRLRSRFWILSGGATGLALGSVAAVLALSRPAPQTEPAAAQPLDSKVESSAALPPITISETSIPSVTPSGVLHTESAGSSVATTFPTNTSPQHRPTMQPYARDSSQKPVASGTVLTPTPMCTSKFEVGPDGVKRYRKECL